MTRFHARVLTCALTCLLTGVLGGCAAPGSEPAPGPPSGNVAPGSGAPGSGEPANDGLRLGNFSVSLAVKDLAASRAFYEKLGFHEKGGDASQGWLVLQNGTATIGLFQGMFEKNMLTFNPGWDRSGNTLADFDDVRDIQRILKSRGLELKLTADESTSGPASVMLVDPDGNPILLDQFVQRPAK
jgi:catechol 2,3-dioxygenase-like lactoylglutathione lyase family enzyme